MLCHIYNGCNKKPLTSWRTKGLLLTTYGAANMSSLSQMNVSFNDTLLYLVEYNNEPYTPMKPIVEGIGLDWASQFIKLKQKFEATIVEITIVANDGKERMMTCLPVRKLAAWLYSISPNKVRPSLRDTVIKYQAECDDVLWDYWTKGQAVNQAHTTSVLEREQLNQAIVSLVAKNGRLNYSDAYKLVHQRFGVEHTHELNRQQLADAVSYVHWLTVSSAADNKPTLPENLKEDIRNLCVHARYLRAWWAQCGEAGIRALNRDMAGGLHDHFDDANMSAFNVVKALGFTDVPELKSLAQYPFEGKGWERNEFNRALVKH